MNQDFPSAARESQKVMFNMAVRSLRNHHDAEDAVQSAFLNAFRAWPRFDGRSHPQTWLISIVLNEANTVLRKRQRRGHEVELPEVLDIRPTAETRLLDSERHEELYHCVNGLPEKYKQALLARLREEEPDVLTPTQRTHVLRGIAMLKKRWREK